MEDMTRDSFLRRILAQEGVPGTLGSSQLLAFGVQVVLAPSSPGLAVFCCPAHQGSRLLTWVGPSSVGKQARWVEREEVGEQQVDACNSLWAACPALTQASPTAGPLAIAVGLGSLRQWHTDTWQPFDKAAPLSRHLTLNRPGSLGCRP
jgi:hypothetical protein